MDINTNSNSEILDYVTFYFQTGYSDGRNFCKFVISETKKTGFRYKTFCLKTRISDPNQGIQIAPSILKNFYLF